MPSVRRFSASVTYPNSNGKEHEEEFPVFAHSYEIAQRMAFAYVLKVLRLQEFELRLVGA
jgi:hypothetical protein